jgi:hypothetical protein
MDGWGHAPNSWKFHGNFFFGAKPGAEHRVGGGTHICMNLIGLNRMEILESQFGNGERRPTFFLWRNLTGHKEEYEDQRIWKEEEFG